MEKLHGATMVAGGSMSDTATAAQLMALQTPGTHVGTPTDYFTLTYHGQTISFRPGVAFIADPLEYAALAGSPVTWSN